MTIWRIRKGKSSFFSLMADVQLTLLAFFMLLIGTVSEQLSQSEAVASLVPDLEREVTGLGGDLRSTKIELGKAVQKGVHLRTDLSRKDGVIDDLKRGVEQLTVENGKLRSRLRAGDPVTLLVLIDVTGSMTKSIEELRESLAVLCEILPNTSKDFRVGILAYRSGVVARFPITPILPTYVDQGKSQKAVLAFVASLEAKGAYTDHLPVFREAFAMLDKAHQKPDPDRKERLVLLGDVGPSELDEKQGYNSAERAMKGRLLKGVNDWAGKGDRAVEALYAQNDFTKSDPAAAESREWFQALGKVSPKSAFYTETSSLLRAVLHASLEWKKS